MKITRIPRKRDLHKKRVAAYCRVSTLLENQEDSFETQVSYYTAFIESNEEWEFAGIYSDEKSGTKADNRPGFQQMVLDALEGRVDYILVKSVSRFSRNIVDCQKYVKLLHGNGVEVRFEKENLDTSDPSCSMMFSFLSTISQDESHSISENVKWAYRERFKRGEYNLGNNRIFGYDSEDGKLVPNEYADAVRTIYKLFLDGKTFTEIADAMRQADVCGRHGAPLTVPGIIYILENEVYVGDKLLQKRAPKNFLTKQPEKGVEFESNYLTEDHEAIIDRDTWLWAQGLMRTRREELDSGKMKYHGGRTHFLYGKVFCSGCGSPMTRRTLRCSSKGTANYKAWECKEHHLGRKGNGCRMRTIREDELLAAISDQMGYPEDREFPVEWFLKEVARVEIGMEAVTVIRAKAEQSA